MSYSAQYAMEMMNKSLAKSSLSMKKLSEALQKIDQGANMPTTGGGEWYHGHREGMKEVGPPVWTTRETIGYPPKAIFGEPPSAKFVVPPPPKLTPLEWLCQQVDEICQLARVA